MGDENEQQNQRGDRKRSGLENGGQAVPLPQDTF